MTTSSINSCSQAFWHKALRMSSQEQNRRTYVQSLYRCGALKCSSILHSSIQAKSQSSRIYENLMRVLKIGVVKIIVYSNMGIWPEKAWHSSRDSIARYPNLVEISFPARQHRHLRFCSTAFPAVQCGSSNFLTHVSITSKARYSSRTPRTMLASRPRSISHTVSLEHCSPITPQLPYRQRFLQQLLCSRTKVGIFINKSEGLRILFR